MSGKARIKHAAIRAVSPLRTAMARAHLIARSGAMTGAYGDLETALAAVPSRMLAGYDHDEVVPVSLEAMRDLAEWDYPVLFWLDRFIRAHEGRFRLVDAGGHVGTKFVAFGTRIDLGQVDWQVYDLPPMVRAGRELAAREGLEVTFTDTLAEVGGHDLLLCSGLLQYLDRPFGAFVGALAQRPPLIILNKVAMREGPTVVTLERIGPALVPYQIRNRAGFLAEIETLGYDILDSWEIRALSRRIRSHPELGASESRGFVLRARG